MPTWRLRLRSPVHVSTRSPRPLRPASVSRRPPSAHRQPRDLGEAARDQRGHRVVPEPSALDDARGDRDDVLQRAADLDADHVVARVEPERGAAELLLHALRGRGIGRRGEHRGRQSARDFRGEARAGQHDDRQGVQRFLRDHLRHARERFRLEPLRRADHDRVAGQPRRRFARHRAKTVRRHREYDERRPVDARAAAPTCSARPPAAQTPAGSASCVACAAISCDERRVPRPQADLVADPAEVDGERGAPAACAENGESARSCPHPHPALGARAQAPDVAAMAEQNQRAGACRGEHDRRRFAGDPRGRRQRQRSQRSSPARRTA